jgi:hypothetical protein
MAQTRRMGKHNQRAYRSKRRGLSPYRSEQITPLDPVVITPEAKLDFSDLVTTHTVREIKSSRMLRPQDLNCQDPFIMLSINGNDGISSRFKNAGALLG